MVAIGATSVAYATPALQLPWPTGQSHYIWGGANGYGCGDHIGRDAYAIDFQLTTGNAVSAVAPGVAHRGPFQQTGYGNFIWIQHDGGIVSIYGHLSSFAVADGQAVSRGQTIGAAGSTGNSTGPHLHFALHAGASNYYSGTGLLPEPMSGYTGFGAYGWCHGGGSPMYTSSPPAGDGDGGGGGGGGGTSAPMTRNLLTNGSFDVDAFKGWDSFPNGFINYASRDDPGGAKEGHGYGAVETDVAGRSFAQDIPISPQPGQS
ncbi:MAG TPA: M23 family metallopeptidase, partial [Solirubrobacteraceae bacterium]